MKHTRIFQSGSYTVGQHLELSPEAGQHVGVVLRMREGEPLTLFCGDNREFLTKITQVRKKRVQVVVESETVVDCESPCAIHLAQGIAKGDRMEWIIQKAVELGINSITPLITAHGAVRLDNDRLGKKHQQWQAIARSACEQCGRNVLPVIHPCCSFNTYLQQVESPTRLVLHPTAKGSWRDLPANNGAIDVLIGPEGGLSDEEINRARNHQFMMLRMGPRILRTETATITALSILQAVRGDL